MNAYPSDWPEIGWKIKDMAVWRCEHCNHFHDPSSGYCLTVHHLDGDKSNCAFENLVALCQRCHLHIQGKWRPGQGWLFGAPVWAVKRGYVVAEAR